MVLLNHSTLAEIYDLLFDEAVGASHLALPTGQPAENCPHAGHAVRAARAIESEHKDVGKITQNASILNSVLPLYDI